LVKQVEKQKLVAAKKKKKSLKKFMSSVVTMVVKSLGSGTTGNYKIFISLNG
jgi:hypothetical protein